MPANIAIASNPDAAMHAARGFRGITVIERRAKKPQCSRRCR